MTDTPNETEATALVLPNPTKLQAAFETGKVDELISRIEAEVRAFVPDLSTAKGRKQITSLAYKVTRSKAPLDEARKALTEEWRAKTDAVNSYWKTAETRLNSLRDETLKPLKAWEEKEEARRAAHEEKMKTFDRARTGSQMSSAEILAVIEDVEATTIDSSWEEFEGLAEVAKEDALSHHRELLTAAQQLESQLAELARLRKEAEEREKRDAEEKAAREAEEEKAREAARQKQQEEWEQQRKEDERKEYERLQAEKRAQRIAKATRLMDYISDCGKGLLGGKPAALGMLMYELETRILPEMEGLLDDDKPRVDQHRLAVLDVLKANYKLEQKAAAEEAEIVKRKLAEEAAEKARQEEAARIKKLADEKEAEEAARRKQKKLRDKAFQDVTNALSTYDVKDMAKAIFDGKIPHVSMTI